MEEFLKQQRKLGNPAFPCKHDFNGAKVYFSGMSLRDWFAGQALTTVLATCYQISRTGVFANDADLALAVAEKSYAIADAMLKEREK